MSKILFIDYDNTLHDTDAKFAPVLDGVYGLSSEQLMETYLLVHRRIIHQQYPEKHDDFFFHQKLIHEHLNRPYDETEARRIASMFKEAQEETWTSPLFYPDTLEFLDKAKENHILCLTTGDFAQKKAKALEKASGKSHFSYVFDNNNLGMKGGSSYFKNALSSTNSRPEDVIAIGDSLEHDIIAAKEAGIKAVWINRKGLPHVTTSPGPDYQARDLIEVLGYINDA